MRVEFEGGSLDGVDYDMVRTEPAQFGDVLWYDPDDGPTEKYLWAGGKYCFFAAFDPPASGVNYSLLTLYDRLDSQQGFLDFLRDSGYSMNFVECLRHYCPLHFGADHGNATGN